MGKTGCFFPKRDPVLNIGNTQRSELQVFIVGGTEIPIYYARIIK